MTAPNESRVELAALMYLRQIGWSTSFGPSIGPHSPVAERSTYAEVYLYDQFRTAVKRIESVMATSEIDEAVKRLERGESQSAIGQNFRIHMLMTQRVPGEQRRRCVPRPGLAERFRTAAASYCSREPCTRRSSEHTTSVRVSGSRICVPEATEVIGEQGG